MKLSQNTKNTSPHTYYACDNIRVENLTKIFGTERTFNSFNFEMACITTENVRKIKE